MMPPTLGMDTTDLPYFAEYNVCKNMGVHYTHQDMDSSCHYRLFLLFLEFYVSEVILYVDS